MTMIQEPAASGETRPKVAIVVHAFYPDVFGEILELVAALPTQHKLFVTTVAEHHDEMGEMLVQSGRVFSLRVTENRGRDVRPFIRVFPDIRAEGYEYIVKVHTKKSLHRRDGETWRKDMLGKLLSVRSIDTALSAFLGDENIGLIGPGGHYLSIDANLGGNKERVYSIAGRLGFGEAEIRGQGFFAGTMFMARTNALEPLLKLDFADEDFEPEEGQLDGTLAHAIERCVGLSALASRMTIASSSRPGRGALEPLKSERGFPTISQRLNPLRYIREWGRTFERTIRHFVRGKNRGGSPVRRG